MDKKPDNVNEPLERQEGVYQRIDMNNLKRIHTQCKAGEHTMEIDPTEITDNWQGYKCSKCGRGELIKL